MPTLPDLKLAYFPVPKVACTSLKLFFFEFENGFPFKDFYISGKHFHIHEFWPSRKFENYDHSSIQRFNKFCVVRDPVERVISCYYNRVLFHDEISPDHIAKSKSAIGLKPRPTLSEFIERFDKYRDAIPSIKHHTDSLVHYLGRSPEFYDQIYNMKDITIFVSDLCSNYNKNIKLSFAQKTNKKMSANELHSKLVKKIQQFYQEDYDVYGDFI